MPAKEAKVKEKKPKPDGYVFGRPTMYSEELANRICREISISTDGLNKICADNKDFPNPKTIYGWRIDNEDFSKKYDAAKRIQADLLVEEIKEIADDTSRDTITKQDRDGNDYDVCNTEWIARSRLRIDTRKWIACKLLPKVYGDLARLDLLQDKNEELTKELYELRAELDKKHKRDY
ncbi:MAG TPA: hypothetical protein VJ279_08500 [Hanamia sp.]|nr:hypothetical protein [Hanamia sp.]